MAVITLVAEYLITLLEKRVLSWRPPSRSRRSPAGHLSHPTSPEQSSSSERIEAMTHVQTRSHALRRSGPSPSGAAACSSSKSRRQQRSSGASARRLESERRAHREADGRRHRQADLPALPARPEPRLLQEVRRQRRSCPPRSTVASAPRTRWPPGRSTWPAPGTSTPSTSRPRARTSSTSSSSPARPASGRCAATNSGVHSAADFKGKTLGVTDLGSGTDELTQFIAAQKGITRKAVPHPRRRRGRDRHRRDPAQHRAVRDDDAADRRRAGDQEPGLLGDRPGHHDRAPRPRSAARGRRPACSPQPAG